MLSAFGRAVNDKHAPRRSAQDAGCQPIDTWGRTAHCEAVAPVDGELGIALFDDRFIQNPYPLYDEMHRRGHVHRIGDSDFYAVSSWQAVNDAVTRSEDFSSNLTATMMFGPDGTITPFVIGQLGGPTQVLATADEPAHSLHRRALLPHLSAKRVRAFESFIADTMTALWDADVSRDGVEWMSAIANRLPMMIVGRIIGVPDSDIDTLSSWGYSATQFLEGLASPTQMEAARAAVAELGGYITEKFRQPAAAPQETLLGDLALACARGELAGIAALTMMITLFSAGGESTASLLGSAAWLLATEPEIQQQVRGEPDLLPDFLEEVLRYEPPFRGHYRHVVRDTELFGVELPAGSRLLLLWGAANRDPAHFDDPNAFRLDRPANKGHITFGKGSHFCVGAALARLEARVVFTHLLERTSDVHAVATGRWLPSLLVRRLQRLELAFAA